MNTTIPFFSALPDAAIPAAQALWDAIDTPGYNALTAYNVFVGSLQAIDVAAPPRAAVRRWAAGVEAGLIDRPGTGENKLRGTAPTHAIVDEVAATPPEPVRPSGTLTLKRELTAEEVGALKAIKESAPAQHIVSSDPVQDAVDIIVNHYEEQEFKHARAVAASKAAAALREFANRIEASAGA